MTIKITGSKVVRADRETIWWALHDIDSLGQCVPGCVSLVRTDGCYTLRAVVALGPVRLMVDGSVSVTESERPSRLVLSGQGTGGLAGHAGGTARITLTETPSGVRVGYNIEAQTHGPLAILGPLFTAGVAKTLIEQFVAAFSALVGGGAHQTAGLSATRRRYLP